MLRVGVDLRTLNSNNKTGIARYTFNIVNALIKEKKENYVLLGGYRNEKFIADNVKFVNIDISDSNAEYANKMLSLAGYIEGLDILFCPYFPVPQRRTFKAIMTVHDLIPLRFPNYFANNRVFEFFDKQIRNGVKYANHIIAVSNSTKEDLIYYYGVPEEKITVTHLGYSITPNEYNTDKLKTFKTKYKITEPYILSVCTLEPRKNLLRLLKAFEILCDKYKKEVELILVGSYGWKNEEFFSYIGNHKYKDKIKITGYVPDIDLELFFQNAELFIYPSLYEGFGLPVLEAMGLGTPVITSNVSSLPEVGGDAVFYCNPIEIDSILNAIETVIWDSKLKYKLSTSGIERAKKFSWENTAKLTRTAFYNN